MFCAVYLTYVLHLTVYWMGFYRFIGEFPRLQKGSIYIFSVQNYILFKSVASGLFLQYS